jgi:hypothetical protein
MPFCGDSWHTLNIATSLVDVNTLKKVFAPKAKPQAGEPGVTGV